MSMLLPPVLWRPPWNLGHAQLCLRGHGHDHDHGHGHGHGHGHACDPDHGHCDHVCEGLQLEAVVSLEVVTRLEVGPQLLQSLAWSHPNCSQPGQQRTI